MISRDLVLWSELIEPMRRMVKENMFNERTKENRMAG